MEHNGTQCYQMILGPPGRYGYTQLQEGPITQKKPLVYIVQSLHGTTYFNARAYFTAQCRLVGRAVSDHPLMCCPLAGSGSPLHYHCPAVNALVYGRKK